jgi:hypothetical protein
MIPGPLTRDEAAAGRFTNYMKRNPDTLAKFAQLPRSAQNALAAAFLEPRAAGIGQAITNAHTRYQAERLAIRSEKNQRGQRTRDLRAEAQRVARMNEVDRILYGKNSAPTDPLEAGLFWAEYDHATLQ